LRNVCPLVGVGGGERSFARRDEPRRSRRSDADSGPGAVGVGWDLALMGLRLHLATGVANDPAESAAWMCSPEGVEFVTRSSRGWADASIATGTDATEARSAEERTTAFYTGMGG
jgi:hypothetical protein